MEKKRTPFFEFEKHDGAFFTEFAGWTLPLHFGSALKEAIYVREDAGFFDITHMGRVEIKGEDAEKLIRKVFTRTFKTEGKGLYGFLISEDGKVVDDTIIFKIKENHFFAVFNAGRKDEDIKLLEYEKRKNGFSAEISDISSDTVFIAIQGPKSEEKTKIFFEKLAENMKSKKRGGEKDVEKIERAAKEIENIGRFSILLIDGFEEGKIFVSRTGYTGEDGFEISMPASWSEEIWESIKEAGIHLCGLASRDILRLEAGLILYGLDLKEDDTPFGSHLERFISPESERYEILRRKFEEKPSFLLPVIFDSPPIPHSGQKTNPDGEITSAVFSPTLKKPIAFGRFREKLPEGTRVIVEDKKGRRSEGKIWKVPFI